jgi:hypothetical protein
MSAEIIIITLHIPEDEALALAQLVKRIDYDSCGRLASRFDRYGGRTEQDTIWAAVAILQRDLAEAGFSPR